jgi:LAGLIDADG DNA endonuclease family
MELTQEQKSILTGLMLGDGCLFLGKSNNNPLLVIGRAEKDIEYLRYHHGIFLNLCSKEGIIQSNKDDKKNNKLYKGYKFRTRALPELLEFYKLWYPDGMKKVPTDLKLDPISIATWICDDGFISRKIDRKGGFCPSAFHLKISTNGFTKSEVGRLADLLSHRYEEKFSIYHDSLSWYKRKNPAYIEDPDRNWFIKTYTSGVRKLFEEVENVFPLGMDRKLNIWKEHSIVRLVSSDRQDR